MKKLKPKKLKQLSKLIHFNSQIFTFIDKEMEIQRGKIAKVLYQSEK